LNSIKNRPNNSEYFVLRFIVRILYVVIGGIGSENGKQYVVNREMAGWKVFVRHSKPHFISNIIGTFAPSAMSINMQFSEKFRSLPEGAVERSETEGVKNRLYQILKRTPPVIFHK